MVRLRTEDGSGVVAEAQAMGLSPAGWVAALVSHRMRGRPRFNRADELALLAIRGERELVHGDFLRIGQHLFRLDVDGGGARS